MALKYVRTSLYTDRPYRVALSTDNPDDEPLEFPENPESWRTSLAPQWKPRNAAGVEVDDADWTGNGPQRIEFRQTLSARGYAAVVNGAVTIDTQKLAALEDFLQRLERFAHEPDQRTGEPRRFLLEMGVTSFNVVIDSLTINRLQTDPIGQALSAEVDLGLLRVENTV